MKKADYKDIESKVKNYFTSHLKQKENNIKGVYGFEHNKYLSNIKSEEVSKALRNYVKYSFENFGNSDMIILNFNFAEKFSEIENNSETTLDQGD